MKLLPMDKKKKRLSRLLGICTAAVLMAGSLWAQQKDWAQFGRYAEANRRVKVPAHVVFMGNSITDHWWQADSLFFLDHNYLDRGISGQTTAEMLVRFRADVLDLQPKAVVILAGTNDVAGNNGYIAPEHTFGNIVSMVELARAHGIRVVLCSILPAYDFPWRRGLEPAGKILRLNEMLKGYADQEGIPYVDYHTALKDDRGGLPAVYSADGVHPTPAGYEVMKTLVQEGIRKALK